MSSGNIGSSLEEENKTTEQLDDSGADFDNLFLYSASFIFLTIFFLGALNSLLHLEARGVFVDSVNNQSHILEKAVGEAFRQVIVKYYDLGDKNPKLFFFVFVIFFVFIVLKGLIHHFIGVLKQAKENLISISNDLKNLKNRLEQKEKSKKEGGLSL